MLHDSVVTVGSRYWKIGNRTISCVGAHTERLTLGTRRIAAVAGEWFGSAVARLEVVRAIER